MNFEKKPRVIYKTNALFEVVCQARFPKILRITKEEPIDFQEKIRAEYPESKLSVPTVPRGFPNEIHRMLQSEKTFHFISEDGNWQVSLANDFLALACLGKYKEFKEFSERLGFALECLSDVYKPAYYNRIGLRYKNLINKTTLPNINKAIAEYIPDHIAPELYGRLKNEVSQFEKNTSFMDKTMTVNTIHTYTNISGILGNYQINDETSYIIDIDCFTEDKIHGKENVLIKCAEFNSEIRNIFRWSISDDLHDLMEPLK